MGCRRIKILKKIKFGNLTTGLGVVTDGLPEDELNRKIVGKYFSLQSFTLKIR